MHAACTCITTDKDLSAMVKSPRPRLGGVGKKERKRPASYRRLSWLVHVPLLECGDIWQSLNGHLCPEVQVQGSGMSRVTLGKQLVGHEGKHDKHYMYLYNNANTTTLGGVFGNSEYVRVSEVLIDEDLGYPSHG